MRDFGPVRNAIYNFKPTSHSSSKPSRSSTQATSECHSPLKKSKIKFHPVSRTEAKARTKVEESPRCAYEFHTVVRANDYTKNISESIFNPGVIYLN
mmetsp:Transcript_32452/g.49653  ORF Transcript_32452/g.49653 Transcript_32452/m.49653 type:complete len:97 (+) Transcript_32452:433-723(+)